MVAVNSGTALSKVSDYARKNRVTIPIIADTDRSLERSAKLSTEISLKNIYQARILKADGSVIRGDVRDLGAAMDRAAAGAEWNIDPTDIPESMKPLWQSVEFGGYAPAAKQIARLLKSRRPAEKAAAGQLNNYITEQLETRLAIAEENIESEPWLAWKQLTSIQTTFKGYDVPSSVAKDLEKLAATDAIKSERAALKQLGLAQKAAAGNAIAQKRAIKILKKLSEKYADTEAAKIADDLLMSVNGNSK